MNIEEYRESIDDELSEALEIAEEAKKGKQDPEDGVGMEIAEDLAERCEKLLEIPGMAERIRELDEEYDREELVFKIAEAFAEGEIGGDLTREEIVDKTVRASVAILTEGIVAAPIDGIGEIKIESGPNGEFIRVPYFGPIRSAGGTGQALSVLIADYIRQLLDIDEFEPTEDEVERYVEELNLYDKDTSLQYLPPDDDIRHIIRNCPVMIDGEQTEELEVGGYRNLDRIKGNRVRGGMCLVVGEGIGLKAPKMKRYTDELDIGGWEWIEELIETSSDEEDEEEESSGEKQIQRNKTPSKDWDKKIKPSKKFLKDALGGRPIFAGASKDGAFRLRYGRSRNTGLAACGYHPATMVIVDKFIANGTQLKTERPGKAAGVAAVDYIEGPTVRLRNGEVRTIQTEEEAEKILNAVDKIIDLGEVLVPYGEFLENNHPIAPSPYVHEWWVQEYEQATGGRIPKDKIKYPVSKEIAQSHNIPIHPKFTYLWHDITKEEYKQLAEQIEKDKISTDIAPILEKLLVPHKKENNQIKLEEPHNQILKDTCSTQAKGDDPVEMASNAANYEIRHRSPTKIGARLGRPEKSSRREMTPPVRGLFPISDKGGNTRDIAEAATNEEGKEMDLTGKGGNIEKGKVTAEVANMKCLNCGTKTWKPKCPDCGKRTEQYWRCPQCKQEGHEGEICGKCDKELRKKDYKEVNVGQELERATNTLGVRLNTIDTIKGVKGLTSSEKIPEPIEKAVLRTKHDIDTFRDGTSRYDLTDLPLTAFKPKEIGLTPEQTKQLGYEKDLKGEPITSDDQLIEIMPQDIIVSNECGEYLKRVADYTDELLQKYYEKEPYYEAETKEDLVGELLIGLAPHTSAGVLGRLIGFTKDKANYTSPFYHAAKRRNADGDEDSVMMLMDGLLNFSEKYLPDLRGKRSVGKDQRVFVKIDGEHRAMKISDLVDDYIDSYDCEERPDGFEVTRDVDENVQVLSFEPDTYEVDYSSVSAFIRHPNDKEVYKVETRRGEVTVTEDHSVFTTQGDGVKEATVSELEVGDNIVTPGNVGFDSIDGGILDELKDEVSDLVDGKGELRSSSEEFVSQLSVVAVSMGYETGVSYDEETDEYVFVLGDWSDDVVERDLCAEKITGIERVDYGDDFVYDLEVPGRENFLCGPHPMFCHNTMDAPLVMTSMLDPGEVDDEAYNVDIEEEYPLEFYERSMGVVDDPGDVDISIAEETVDDGAVGLRHSVSTSDISAGPEESAYKHMGGMDDAIEEQLALAEKTRGVDASLVGVKVIENHLIPDIIGNLRAFSSQKVRCAACNTQYRRVPLTGECENCGNDLIFTVHEKSVKKYLDIANYVIDNFDVPKYTRERVILLENRIEQLFHDDSVNQAEINDFF